MSGSIMVIDDSPTMCKILEVCLHREGYPVITFPDGIAALTWLHQSGISLPSLLFLDIVLPKLDGYEIAHYLQTSSQFRQMTIIMLTRRECIVDRLKARLVGAKAYLTKPIRTQVIISTVHHYIGPPDMT